VVTSCDHAPFMDSLSSIGWDLLSSTCTPNLNYVFTCCEDMEGKQNVEMGCLGGGLEVAKVTGNVTI